MRHTLLFVLGMSLLIGCQSARVDSPLTQRPIEAGDEGRLSFWHALPETGLVSNDDAFHALTLYFDGQDDANGYDQRVAALKGRGWLRDNFSAPANEAVKRGTVAVAIVQALNVEGGVMMRLLGPSPRYATRELAYMNLFPLSSPQQTFSGTQLVELISKVEDWQRAHPSLESPQPPLEGEAPPPGTLAKAAPAAGERIMKITARRQQMLAVLMAMIGTPTMFAQAQPAPAPADAAPAAPANPNALPVVVTAVNGLVQVRTGPDQPWQVPTVGQNLTTGAEFRTGPRSSVIFKVGDTQTVTLDRLGTVTVIDALRQADGSIVADVGMKYGRSTMQVQAAGVEHQSRIRSPGATLSVRGSVGSLEDIGSTLRAAGLEGDVAWARGPGRFITLPPDSEHEGDDASTGENRLADGTYNPTPFGTTPIEQFLYSYFTNGAFENQQQLGFDTFSDLQNTSSGFSMQEPPQQLMDVTVFFPLVFNLFDFGTVDNDMVELTIRSGGSLVEQTSITLAGPPGQTFTPEVGPGRVTITLRALNLGDLPNNTGQIQILSQVLDGPTSQQYDLVTGQQASLLVDIIDD